MARSVEAIVEPSVLTWARTSAGLSVVEAARSLQTKPDRVMAWEGGNTHPSMSQLRRMATTYKRLLSDFYLPAPPIEDPIPHDFRRLPGEVALHYSRALRYQLRQAWQRRAIALDLADEMETPIPVIEFTIKLGTDPELAGAKVREILGLDLSEQRTWRIDRKSYNGWRGLIEKAGVLVFQAAGIPPKEMLGFSFAERPLPVIGINRKLALNGRTFTLLHEFAHVLLGASSICDIEEAEFRRPEEQKTEVFCNAVAAAALVPRQALLSEPLVSRITDTAHPWSDDELEALGRMFGASKETILRRLLTAGRTTQAFYAHRRAAWQSFFELTPPPDEAESENTYRRNMPQEVVSDLGKPFTRLVLDSYHNSRMSLSDASRFLGLRAQQVGKVRELVLRG